MKIISAIHSQICFCKSLISGVNFEFSAHQELGRQLGYNKK